MWNSADGSSDHDLPSGPPQEAPEFTDPAVAASDSFQAAVPEPVAATPVVEPEPVRALRLLDAAERTAKLTVESAEAEAEETRASARAEAEQVLASARAEAESLVAAARSERDDLAAAMSTLRTAFNTYRGAIHENLIGLASLFDETVGIEELRSAEFDAELAAVSVDADDADGSGDEAGDEAAQPEEASSDVADLAEVPVEDAATEQAHAEQVEAVEAGPDLASFEIQRGDESGWGQSF